MDRWNLKYSLKFLLAIILKEFFCTINSFISFQTNVQESLAEIFLSKVKREMIQKFKI